MKKLNQDIGFQRINVNDPKNFKIIKKLLQKLKILIIIFFLNYRIFRPIFFKI